MQNTVSITLSACLVEAKEGNTTSTSMEGHLHGGKGGQYDLHGGACIDAMQWLANLIALPFSLFVRIGVLVSPNPLSWGSKDEEGDAIHTWQFLSFRIIVLHIEIQS